MYIKARRGPAKNLAPGGNTGNLHSFLFYISAVVAV